MEKLDKDNLELAKRKNADYAGSDDAFKNFKLIEALTDGSVSVEQGILVRISDKVQRIAHLLERENQVQDEKLSDTVNDLSVYAKILKIYLDDKNTTV